MSRRLLEFNPEAHGLGGDTYLFGVPVPAVSLQDASKDLEQLYLASDLLDARTTSEIAALVERVMNRTAAVTGRRINPHVRALLLPRLTRIGQVLRTALSRDRQDAGTPASIEAIFGTELEGLSPEDQEFEAARLVIRLLMLISRHAALAPEDAAPEVVASRAEHLAARHLAPGLGRVLGPPPVGFRARRRARSGR